MLSAADDLLLHQLPTTFDHASSSDKRWFDRNVFFAVDHGGKVAVATGMGVYKNTNVSDGYGAVIFGGKQYNFRASRHLRPQVAERVVGPLRQEVVEGLRLVRLTLGPNPQPIEFDLTWEAIGHAFEEPHHFRRREGRVVEDYLRFNQAGRASGWVKVEGQRVDLAPRTTWGGRDHSWGVRPGMGGPEPGDGYPPKTPGLSNWIWFHAGGLQGYLYHRDDGDGNLQAVQGEVSGVFGDDRPRRQVVAFSHALRFPPGSRRLQSSDWSITDDSGRTYDFRDEAVIEPMNEQGWGYQRGYEDTLGMGAPRGSHYEETDTFDLSDPARVVNLGPTTYAPQDRNWDNLVRLRHGDTIGYAVHGVFSQLYRPHAFEG